MEVDLYPLLPESCAVNQKIPVEKILKLGSPNDDEAYLIKLYTIKVTLRYLFRINMGHFPSIPLRKNSNEELHILEAEIKTRSDGWYRIHAYAKAIIQCYPQNLLLILRYKDEYCYFISKTHYNSRNTNKNVADSIRGSGWFSDENCQEFPIDPRVYSPVLFKYQPTRNTVSHMIYHFNTLGSIDNLLKAWFKDIEEDRSAWSYFLHWDNNYYAHEILASEERDREKRAEKILIERVRIDEKYSHLEDDDDDYEDDDESLLEQSYIIGDEVFLDDYDDDVDV